ncbi:MAG: hypothetical protein ACI9DJ_001907 [Algoriphagus sp.]|jgi:hypothetical protein
MPYISMFDDLTWYIFSKSPAEARSAIILKGNIKPEIERIKKEVGKDICFLCGASLISIL